MGAKRTAAQPKPARSLRAVALDALQQRHRGQAVGCERRERLAVPQPMGDGGRGLQSGGWPQTPEACAMAMRLLQLSDPHLLADPAGLCRERPARVVLLTECSMSDNVAVHHPDVEFIRPCNLCPHMKRITLPKILDSLVYLRDVVTIDPALAARARRSVQRMIDLG